MTTKAKPRTNAERMTALESQVDRVEADVTEIKTSLAKIVNKIDSGRPSGLQYLTALGTVVAIVVVIVRLGATPYIESIAELKGDAVSNYKRALMDAESRGRADAILEQRGKVLERFTRQIEQLQSSRASAKDLADLRSLVEQIRSTRFTDADAERLAGNLQRQIDHNQAADERHRGDGHPHSVRAEVQGNRQLLSAIQDTLRALMQRLE